MSDNVDSEYTLPWRRQAVLDAYKRSGLTVDDINVFETHDCFTSSDYAAISAFGLTEPRKEYEAIESGLIDFDGEKPINPYGVYVLNDNAAFVNLGTSADTGVFSVESIRRW